MYRSDRLKKFDAKLSLILWIWHFFFKDWLGLKNTKDWSARTHAQSRDLSLYVQRESQQIQSKSYRRYSSITNILMRSSDNLHILTRGDTRYSDSWLWIITKIWDRFLQKKKKKSLILEGTRHKYMFLLLNDLTMRLVDWS